MNESGTTLLASAAAAGPPPEPAPVEPVVGVVAPVPVAVEGEVDGDVAPPSAPVAGFGAVASVRRPIPRAGPLTLVLGFSARSFDPEAVASVVGSPAVVAEFVAASVISWVMYEAVAASTSI